MRAKDGKPAPPEARRVTGDRADRAQWAERAELRALFEDAAAGLDLSEREIIELRLRRGLEAGEVATVLSVPRGRAHALLSRAREQLEACLGVLLVGRAGRGECGRLRFLLAGWDGRLTAGLRKRVHRHIEHCGPCRARRDHELRPARLLGLSPGEALAAGAAESSRHGPGVPARLRARTIALATGHGPGAAAHSSAVLGRAGAFGRHGFPRPTGIRRVVRAGRHALGAAGAGLRSSRPWQAAAAATVVVVAVIVAVSAFGLAGYSGHFTAAGNPSPPRPGPAPVRHQVRPAAAAAPTAPSGPTGARPASSAPGPAPAAARIRPAGTPAAGTARTPVTAATAALEATAAAAAAGGGPLLVLPGGGTLPVIPGTAGTSVLLRAAGGTVHWSVSVARDPDHVVSVSPGDAGTLTPARPVATLTIRVSRFVRCGPGAAAQCPTLTISPGDTVLTLWTGWTGPLPVSGTRPLTLSPGPGSR